MSECHPTVMLMDVQNKLSATIGTPVAGPSEYHSLTGALEYLNLTWSYFGICCSKGVLVHARYP